MHIVAVAGPWNSSAAPWWLPQRLMADYYEKIGKGKGRSDAMRDVTLKMLAVS